MEPSLISYVLFMDTLGYISQIHNKTMCVPLELYLCLYVYHVIWHFSHWYNERYERRPSEFNSIMSVAIYTICGFFD
jgi:hypothetical protein